MRTENVGDGEVRIVRDIRGKLKFIDTSSRKEFEPRSVEEKVKLGQLKWWFDR